MRYRDGPRVRLPWRLPAIPSRHPQLNSQHKQLRKAITARVVAQADNVSARQEVAHKDQQIADLTAASALTPTRSSRASTTPSRTWRSSSRS